MGTFRAICSAVTLMGLSTVPGLAADMTTNDPGNCAKPTAAESALGCVCMLPIKPPPPTGVVLLDKIKGNVLKSTDVGYTPISDPTWLKLGDTVLVKDQSEATLADGANCQRTIGPNVSLVIHEVSNGCACAALLGEKQAAAVAIDPSLVLLGLGAGAGAVLLLHPASPVSH